MADDPGRGLGLATRATVREMVIVVVSILIAFSLDAWWDDTRARSDGRDQLAGVLQELEAAAPVLNGAVSTNALVLDRVAAVRQLLRTVEDGSEVAVPDSLVGPILVPIVFEIPTAVTEAFLSTADWIDLLENPQQEALRNWPIRVDDVRDDQVQNREFLSREFNPFLRSHFELAEAQDRAIPWIAAASPGSDVVVQGDLSVILERSDALLNLLSWRETMGAALLRDLRALEEDRLAVATAIGAVGN